MLHLFDQAIQVSSEWLEFSLKNLGLISWDSFLLNPRRLRGSDFLMRWAQGVWSEDRLIAAVNATNLFLRYLTDRAVLHLITMCAPMNYTLSAWRKQVCSM